MIDAALAVFAERGIRAAQLDEVARRAGVTRGALYHHFTGKDTLLAAVLAERWPSAMAPVVAPLREARDRAAALAFVERFLAAVDRDPQVRALLALSLSGELARELPPTAVAAGRDAKATAFASWTAQLARCVPAGVARRDARLRAETCVHALIGYATCAGLYGPPADRRGAARAAAIVRSLDAPA